VLVVIGTTLVLAVLAMILDGQTVPFARIAVFATFSAPGTVLVARYLAALGQPT
jgi:hypothetical protein